MSQEVALMEKGWIFEDWIWDNLTPLKRDSASLLYERMESQSDYKLPGIYQPFHVYDKGHWHDIAITSAFAAAMGEANRILDIGPGDGWPILRIAHLFEEAIGIDLSPKRVQVQRENASVLGIENVEFLVMDSMDLTFPKNSFDGVMAASSIEQSQNPKKTLQEIARVLKEGGRLAIYFEDLQVYFPNQRGDERLFVDFKKGEPLLFYSCREKETLREAVYGLFLHEQRLDKDPLCKKKLEEMGTVSWKTFHGEALPKDFFSTLKPFLKECHYFQLSHLSPEELERDLRELGFVEFYSLDPFMSDVIDFYNLAEKKGYLSSFTDSFQNICELMGILKVKEGEEGCGTFTIAKKG